MKDLICFLLLPESDPATRAETLQRTQPLAAAFDARVVGPAPTMAEFVRQQIPTLVADFVFVCSRDRTTDAATLQAGLASLQAKISGGENAAGLLFRSAALRTALRAPLVDSEPIYLEVVDAWLRLNLAVVPGFDARPSLATPHTPRQALALVALVHHFLCRCAVLPETEPLRRIAVASAIDGWFEQRQALPAAASEAVDTLLAQGRHPSLEKRLRVWWSRLTPTGAIATEVSEFAAEIEYYLPGLFGGPALGDTVLQPPT